MAMSGRKPREQVIDAKNHCQAAAIAQRAHRPRYRGPDRPGKIQLLEKIREFGSISAAGRAMDMSYKRAWDLVDEINRICRQAAVERQTGGKNGGGAALTPFGVSLVARYRKIERDAASAVKKELAALRSDIGKPKKVLGR